MLRFLLPLLLVTSIQGQTSKGFIDIEWLTFREQVKYYMQNVMDLELKRNEDSMLVFKGGEFAENPVKFWSLYFFENKFYHVDVVLDTIKGQDVEIWSKTLRYLEGLYGKSNDFEKTAKNQTVIYWSFFDNNGELQTLIQLFRTLKNNLESTVQISYTYLPLYKKAKKIK